MYNAKSMDMASFVTSVALANLTMMDTYFPLYNLAPKMTAILEPGDVLLNPQVCYLLFPGPLFVIYSVIHLTIYFMNPWNHSSTGT